MKNMSRSLPFLPAFFLASFGCATADELAKSGSINIHSGYYAIGEVVTVGEKHMQGHGNNRGVTFNDTGSGPLHLVLPIASIPSILQTIARTRKATARSEIRTVIESIRRSKAGRIPAGPSKAHMS